eukprot:Sspe_Gene.116275::Locus_105076_Transcript_1_1_Confidence_1.000_Length_601::g.116275::m.116275/K14965/DPY30; protein dpy-30
MGDSQNPSRKASESVRSDNGPEEDRSKVLIDLFDDPELAAVALHASQTTPNPPSLQSLPPRTYLDQTVIPILLQGLDALAQARTNPDPAQRPDDPVEYLAAYLFKNNPQKSERNRTLFYEERQAAMGVGSPPTKVDA